MYKRAINEGEREVKGISLNNLAWLTALKDNKVKEALDYANVPSFSSRIRPIFFTRAIVHLKAGDLQLALDDLMNAIAIDPSSPFKYFHRKVQLANNEKEKAGRAG